MTKQRINSARKSFCSALLLCLATAIPSPAQTFSTLLSFNGTGGGGSNGAFAQGLDGDLYATAEGGPQSDDAGTIYKITPSGMLTTLYAFACQGESCPNGADPYAGLVLATDGSFYGTTTGGGAVFHGTVFRINHGDFALLHSFNYKQGRDPYAGLIQATDGNLYGTTEQNGSHNGGTVFKITPGGKLTTLYNFCSQTNCADGQYPYAGLVQAADGNFYGTTLNGGTSGSECGNGVSGCGTVFKITPVGTLTTLYSFCSLTNCTDGANPYAGLVQAADGNFYGTTWQGGNCPPGCSSGTVFRITSAGTLTTLHAFDVTDGSKPYAGLVQATDGNFYGTTSEGGAHNQGTVFKITSGGTLTNLHSFCSQTNCADGADPRAGLTQATNGSLYGTTSSGGAIGAGTVFKLSSRWLVPFVESLPTSGNVGAAVIILGTKLAGTTAVSFSGTAATFTVVSGTEITTTVPSGATTGFVTVTTPSGKLKSNKKFRIIS
jgi:uncharacterized repeat protein (TIGR03803 family)